MRSGTSKLLKRFGIFDVPVSSQIKAGLNAVLHPLNLRIGTRTAERREFERRAALVATGHFDKPVFPVPRQFTACRPDDIISALRKYRTVTGRFADPQRSGYCFANSYFTSPDAEVAYAMVRLLRPGRIIEVGSGHSTSLFREAIRDAEIATELIAIDPSPRRTIEAFADQIIPQPIEHVPASLLETLSANNILFIDSSHQVLIGNDVVTLALNVLPNLSPGVVVHLHDIFLPWDYPKQWLIDYKWEMNEQYLVQALLQGSTEFDVLWPGHFLQKTYEGFASLFDSRYLAIASSLWLKKRA